MSTERHAVIKRLATRFPALAKAPGVWPWNPNQLDIWASEVSEDPEAVMAARFLLTLWNSNTEWQCGRFSVIEAREVWSRSHLNPFLDWIGQEQRAA